MAMARNSSAEKKQITAYSKCGKRGWMQIFYARVLSLLDDVNKNTTVHYTPRQIYRRQTRVKKKADGREGRYQKLHLETLLFYFTPQEHKRMTQRADMLVGSDEQMNLGGGILYTDLGGLGLHASHEMWFVLSCCWKTCMVIISTKSYLFFLSISPSSAVPSKLASCSADSNNRGSSLLRCPFDLDHSSVRLVTTAATAAQ